MTQKGNSFGVEVETEIDLGTAKIGDPIPYEFKGKNWNTHIVKIKQTPACGCTTAEEDTILVLPEQEFSIKGTLSPRKNKGHVTKTVTLTFNSKAGDLEDKKGQIILTFHVYVQ